MRIFTNVNAINAQRNLGISQENLSKAMERLSSGKRINRAADDAAGLAIGQKLEASVRGLGQAVRNAQDGISMVQTAEGGIETTTNILQRMRELSVQASNGSLDSSDRTQITQEFQQLQSEITRIANVTKYGTQSLLTGGMGQTAGSAVGANVMVANGISAVRASGAVATTYTIQVSNASVGATGPATLTVLAGSRGSNGVVGAASFTVPGTFNTTTVNIGSAGIQVDVNAAIQTVAATGSLFLGSDVSSFTVTGNGMALQVGAGFSGAYDQLSFSISDMTAGSTGLAVASLLVDTASNAQVAITSIMTAIGSVNSQRATLGAIQNRLEHAINNLNVSYENTAASESRIMDADFAMEVSNMVRGQILAQAGTSIAAQANQLPQQVLSLLR